MNFMTTILFMPFRLLGFLVFMKLKEDFLTLYLKIQGRFTCAQYIREVNGIRAFSEYLLKKGTSLVERGELKNDNIEVNLN